LPLELGHIDAVPCRHVTDMCSDPLVRDEDLDPARLVEQAERGPDLSKRLGADGCRRAFKLVRVPHYVGRREMAVGRDALVARAPTKVGRDDVVDVCQDCKVPQLVGTRVTYRHRLGRLDEVGDAGE
jgi:hypothetical protein